MLAAGAIAVHGDASPLLLVALAAAGTVMADHLWYFAGALGSARLLRLHCRLSFSSGRCRRRTQQWFRRFGALTILLGRFLAGVRLLAWPLARQHGVRYGTFLVCDVAGALLWTGLWVGLGWLLGDQWPRAAEHAAWLVPAALVAGLLAVIGSRLWRRARHGPSPS